MAVAAHPRAGTRRRFTADEYRRMAEAGILAEDERIELIAGEIVEMSPIGVRHADCVIALTNLLGALVGREVSSSVQNPIRLATDGEPQPDLALLRQGRYRQALPTADDVLLLIEVADSSRDYDRKVKLPLYAAAGIAEVWLVDLVAETIERYTEPRDGRYSRLVVAGRGATSTSIVLPALAIPVDDILG